MLSVAFGRLLAYSITREHHVGAEAAILYWHWTPSTSALPSSHLDRSGSGTLLLVLASTPYVDPWVQPPWPNDQTVADPPCRCRDLAASTETTTPGTLKWSVKRSRSIGSSVLSALYVMVLMTSSSTWFGCSYGYGSMDGPLRKRANTPIACPSYNHSYA